MIKKGKICMIYRIHESNITIINLKKIGVHKLSKIFVRNPLEVNLFLIVDKRISLKGMDMISFLITSKRTVT
jgi:hypothetical protein